MKKGVSFILLSFLFLILMSCRKNDGDINKIKDIDFTVCNNDQLPGELLSIIDERKENSFKLTYRTKDYLYIAIGYGEQQSGGYSITVDSLFLTDNSIYIDTNLMGASSEDIIENTNTCPYIVIKCELYDIPVVFQ